MAKTETSEHAGEGSRAPGSGHLFRVVFHAIRRHPVALLGVILLAVGAGASIWFFLPLPKNTAAVVFHISSQDRSLLGHSSESRVDFASYKQSQLALIKSRKTLSAALKYKGKDGVEVGNLGIVKAAEPDVLTWLDKYLTFDTRSNAEYMRVTVEGDNAEQLVILLEGVTKAYMDATSDRDSGARGNRLKELEKIQATSRQELSHYHSKIDTIAEALGSKDLITLAILETFRQDSLRAAVSDHASLQDNLTNAKARLEATKKMVVHPEVGPGVLAAVGSGLANVEWLPSLPRQWDVPAALVEEGIRLDPGMRERELAVIKSRQALVDTESLFNPGTNFPAVVKAREELKAAEDKRDKYRTELRSEVLLQLKRNLSLNEEKRVATLKAEHDDLVARIARAGDKVDAIKKEISKANALKIELETVKSEIAQKEKVASGIDDDIARMRIDKVPPRVSVSEEPYVIPGIEGNRRLKYAVLAAVAVFLMGFGGLVFWEYRGRRVTHTDEVSAGLGTRLIGTIPPLSTTSHNEMSEHTSSVLVEAIDTTRTMLLHASPQGSKLRVMAVTSAVSGEGKTTLSGHLAISLARAGFRTLLIDGDMHAPTAHELFDVANSPGLSELLRGETTVVSAVHQSPIQGLSIIPAGKWTHSTRQALAGSRWSQLKRELESRFDFVVIDTSPLLLVSDTLLLVREVDGVVLSVLLGVTQIARVAETIDRLRAVNASLVGVVVHNVQSEVHSYGYGYGYGAKYWTEPSTQSTELPMAEVLSGADSETMER